MPILTGGGGGDADFSDLHSYSRVPPLLRPLDTPTVKGLQYLRARALRPREERVPVGTQIIINVGGLRYAMLWTTLAEFPSTRLGRLCSCSSHADILKLCDDYDVARNEFFFDRHPGAFRMIMTFLRAGKLRLLQEMCALAFRDELRYWGIDEAQLDWCCRRKLLCRMEEGPNEARNEVMMAFHAVGFEGRFSREDDVADDDDEAEGSRSNSFMEKIRAMVDDPHSGLPGKIFACLSVIFVMITAVSLCVSTMPDLRAEEDKVGSHFTITIKMRFS